MMVVIHVPYSNIDKMTDTYIEKSTTFTITGEVAKLAIPLPTTVSFPHLRLSPPAGSKVGDVFNLMLDYTLVLIPNNLSEEQIRSLSDVEILGGKIITTFSTNITLVISDKP